ncbi:MAG: hypothetical protein LIO79_08035 [Rikenellaceae bacterium]|nr:hypothetical protein [Rikenellaceae bacterium]
MKIAIGWLSENYDSLYICGDIHGEFRTLLYNVKRYNLENAVVVVAGDCGIGFEKPAHYDQLYRKLLSTVEKLKDSSFAGPG